MPILNKCKTCGVETAQADIGQQYCPVCDKEIEDSCVYLFRLWLTNSILGTPEAKILASGLGDANILINPDETIFLLNTLQSRFDGTPIRMVEIGALEGGLSLMLQHLNGLTVPFFSQYYIVDCCTEQIDSRVLELPYIQTILCNTGRALDVAEALQFIGKPIDVLFIDACHEYEYVKRDFYSFIGLLKIGGLVIMHDPGKPGVKKFIDELKEIHSDRIKIENGFCIIDWH